MKTIQRLAMACTAITWYFWPTPARATDNYAYKPHEYATIWHGKSPNKRFSIATHGEGDEGYDNFHAYLFIEPGHKRIGPLEEISGNLDTGPLSFCANWSPDSRHVAICYRSDRHVLEVTMYRIENQRAYPIAVPVLVNALAATIHKNGPADGDIRYRYGKFKWRGNNRFEITEVEGFRQEAATFGRAAGKFARYEGESSDNGSPSSYWTEFAAIAVCVLGPGDSAKIASLIPWHFDETITLSPHLWVYKGDLRNTQTTLMVR